MLELELISEFPHEILATDEAGRGPLGGPVVVGAIGFEIKNSEELKKLLKSLKKLGIDDSKKLSHEKRKIILNRLGVKNLAFKSKQLIQIEEVKIKVVTWEISSIEIDQENILAASLRGMKESSEFLASSKQKRKTVLIDGHMALRGDKKFSWNEIPIIKGDSRSLLIGLASIIAKEKRDVYMREMHELYPQYGFDAHFGYPTKKHREAIEEYGPCPIHRKTFKGVKEFVRPME